MAPGEGVGSPGAFDSRSSGGEGSENSNGGQSPQKDSSSSETGKEKAIPMDLNHGKRDKTALLAFYGNRNNFPS